MKKTLSVSVLLPVLLLGAATTGFGASFWGYMRAIDLKNAGGKPAAVELDEKVYDGALPILDDIRILSGSAEVPYLLMSQPEVLDRQKISLSVLSSDVKADETTFVLDLGAPGTYNEIRLVPKRSNFFRKITLEGSDNRSNWTVIRKGMPVYDLNFEEKMTYLATLTNETYAGYSFGRYTSSNMSFEFPPASYRYLRVVVPHGQDKEPVELENAEVFQSRKLPALEKAYSGAVVQTDVNPAEKSVDLVIDFGSRNLPVGRLEIDSPTDNFVRRVEVSSSNDKKEWRMEGGGTIFSMDLYGSASSSKTVTFGEARARYFKITVYNGDNKPIKISKVTAYGLKRFAVFLPSEGKKYSLAYGNPLASAPRYDLAQVLKGKKLADFEPAALAAESQNPDFTPPPDGKIWIEKKPYLLWAAMVFIALALLGLALQIVRKTDEK